ncbi:MAG TPA: glycosyltransferase, partial [Burkholderiales bacterium]|nr:glycosyltransferase [Burkholderiales bacterium]
MGLVIPAYNEAENIPVLVRELLETFEPTGHTLDILFVDDGSSDATADLIRRIARTDVRIRGLILTRNFGHQAAISIGL